jgi:hypothetical protein
MKYSIVFLGEQHIKVAGEVYLKKETAEYLWGYSAESIEYGSLVPNSYRDPFSCDLGWSLIRTLAMPNFTLHSI